MPILVTGATGFIGTNLVRQLVADGQSVRILRREHSNRLGLEKLSVEEHIGDIRNYNAVRRAVSGCQQIYHLAALLKIAPFERQRFEQINIVGSENVAKAALDEGVEKVVYTSSIAAVGYGTREQPANEGSHFNLGSFKLPYIDTKRQGELAILESCKAGLNAVIVNPGYVFGPWQKKAGLNQLFIHAAQGRLWFYVPGGLSIVDVDDVVAGHLLAMAKGASGERYILSNLNLPYKELITLLNEFVQQPPPKIRIPQTLMLPGGYLAELAGKVFGFNPGMSSGIARMAAINHYVSSDKARNQLGYTTTPLAESISKTFSWLREYEYIDS